MDAIRRRALPARQGEELESWRPPLDVFETPEAFVVCAELPGVEGRSIQVSYAGGLLTIAGEKPPLVKDLGKEWRRRESAHGPFRLRVPVPCAVDERRIEAVDHLGILTVSLPKLAGGGGHRIQIRRG
jgi:HSP20 family protein